MTYKKLCVIIKILNEEGSSKGAEENKTSGSYNQTPTLNQYGSDLTKLAKEGKLDPVVCYTSLWEVVSTNLLCPVTCSDLALTKFCLCIMCFGLF
mgnify:CR=1 FL=1